MFKIATLLAAVAILASAPSSSDAKNPKGCKRTNVRPANPQGSVLTQPATRSAAAGTAAPGEAGMPVMVFGSVQSTAGGGTVTGTVVPSITSEPGPETSSAKPQRKPHKSGRSAATDPSPILGAAAISASSSC